MIVIHTDGAMDGDGWSGAGIVIHAEGAMEKYSIPIGKRNTNQEAEFEAMVQALFICKQSFPGEILSFRSDARVVVDTVEKNFIKNKSFQPYLQKIQQLSKMFPYVFIKRISQMENEQADYLAKKAIYENS